MNKSIIKLFLLGGLTITSITSCTDNYMDYNKNPYEVTDDEMERDAHKLGAALVGMQSVIVPVGEHLAQFSECLLGGVFSGYMADSKTWGNSFSYFNQSEDWNGKVYLDIMPEIYSNLAEVKKSTTDPIPLAVAEVLKVTAIVRVTDVYGPIPYSQVGQDGKLTAPFDTQKDVYTKMFQELSDAITTLTANRTNDFSPNADQVFGGKVEKWIKFANSLKLRMAIRIRYADATLAEQMVKEAISTENGQVGVMENNDDNAFMKVSLNPFYTIFGWGDSRIGADLLTYMNAYEDPRRSVYALKSTFAGSSITNGYHGLRIGNEHTAVDAKMYSNMNVAATAPLMWMNAAEVMFLRAEAALLGWDTKDTPENYYKAGIRLSFGQHGVSNVESYLEGTTAPSSYKDPKDTYTVTLPGSAVSVKWSGADNEVNLERIITQKWIANFPLSLEGWADFRRTGYPRLLSTPNNKSNEIAEGKFARRLKYPQQEYNTNKVNVDQIVSTLPGGDKMSTHIWWDCNPRLSNE